jgi:preprotein translocase subunit SecA
VLAGEDLHEQVRNMVDEVIADYVAKATAEGFAEEWDLDQLWTAFRRLYPDGISANQLIEEEGGAAGLTAEGLTERMQEDAQAAYDRREEELTPEVTRELERRVVLSVLDTKWREHLYEMDYLEEGIHLRAYGQRDPLTEYRREAFAMFDEMKTSIRDEFVRYIFHVELVRNDEPARPRPQRVQMSHGDDPNSGQAPQATSDKVGRNAPCPCGSGRKYKKCHGLSA